MLFSSVVHPKFVFSFQFVDLQSPAWKNQPVYLHSMLATSLPSRSLKSNTISLSLGSRPTQAQELFTLVLCLFGTASRCLSIQPCQFLPSRNIWRHISLTWPFPHRHQHAQWPIDVTKLFVWFCCWTLIWLSRHWAWLRQGYWRYWNLIDWLILSPSGIVTQWIKLLF